MFFALIVTIVLGILALYFHQMAMHGQAMAFRFEKGEIVRQIAESAADEAFMRLYRATRDAADPANGADDQVVRWVLQPGPAPLALTLPLCAQQFQRILGSSFRLKLEAQATHVDFRRNDSQGRAFFPGEGVGTVQISIEATIYQGEKKKVAGCAITRHHDFKVLTIVSPRTNSRQRTEYAHNFVLDYAFLVRDGLSAFRKTLGLLLNNDKVRLEVRQPSNAEQAGKIYFGGTSRPGGPSTAETFPDGQRETPSGNYVFINVSDDRRDLVPTVAAAQNPPGQLIHTIDDAACHDLFPTFPSNLKGLKGAFYASNEPLARPASAYAPGQLSEVEGNARSGAVSSLAKAETNLYPGFDLYQKDSGLVPESLLEGAIRLRHLYFVHFLLDLSEAYVEKSGRRFTPSSSEITDLRKVENHIPCFRPPVPAPQDSFMRNFFEKLETIDENRPRGVPPLVSRFNADFLLKPGQTGFEAPPAAETFPIPAFFNSRGASVSETQPGKQGALPYRHFNLYSRRYLSTADLLRHGILTPGTNGSVLHLRGIVSTDEPVILGTDGPVTIEGKGVLVAPGFIIKSGIRKGPKALGVLFAQKGNIQILTSDEIQAALVAMGDDLGSVIHPTRPMKVSGLFACDRFNPSAFAEGKHEIAYDPGFKVAQPVWSVDLSRWVNFVRYLETGE